MMKQEPAADPAPARRRPGPRRAGRLRPGRRPIRRARPARRIPASCATTPTRTASSTAPNGTPARKPASSSSTPTRTASSPSRSCSPQSRSTSDRALERQEAFFRRMDTDHDGFVSKAEFMAQADKNFARCDLDKDGRINTAECRQALRRQPVDGASARACRPARGRATRRVPDMEGLGQETCACASLLRRPPAALARTQVLSACMTSPNRSQVSPLKRASWTAWIG